MSIYTSDIIGSFLRKNIDLFSHILGKEVARASGISVGAKKRLRPKLTTIKFCVFRTKRASSFWQLRRALCLQTLRRVKMTEEVKNHLGFTAHGDLSFDNGLLEADYQVQEESPKEGLTQSDCTILWWNGNYQRPNISISKGKINVSLGRNVKKIQLRHVASGAIRFYSSSGSYQVPNGDYVLSLFGSTNPYKFIKACVSYD